MRESLVQQAIVGLARQSQPPGESGWQSDSLLTHLPQASAERRFLLQVGIETMYIAAGRPLATVDLAAANIEEAKAESLPYCSARFASTLQTALNSNLLEPMALEAFTLLTQARQIVPPDLLSTVLDLRENRFRDVAGPVIGNRGRWLAQFKKNWKWALGTGGVVDSAMDVNRLWQEGTTGERIEVLRHLRQHDVARSRELLGEAIAQEKAPTRFRMLETLETNLSADDIPLLEELANSDRSATVKALTVDYLSRLPESELSRRMTERAKLLFILEGKTLQANPPATLPDDWKSDGITETPPDKSGAKAWWVKQVVGMVPPSVWEGFFRSDPSELIEAASNGDWSDALLSGWVKAATRHQAISWGLPLLEALVAMTRRGKKKATFTAQAISDLGPLISHLGFPEQESVIQQLFDTADDEKLFALLHLILTSRQTWGTSLSQFFMQRLRKSAVQVVRSASHATDFSLRLVYEASFRLSPDCFEAALRPFELPEASKHHQFQVHSQIREFQEVIWMRQDLHKEIRSLPTPV